MTAPIKPAVNYAVAERDLKYYIFDWDNNILHMPTLIHLERRTDRGDWVPHAVSTAVFSVIRATILLKANALKAMTEKKLFSSIIATMF